MCIFSGHHSFGRSWRSKLIWKHPLHIYATSHVPTSSWTDNSMKGYLRQARQNWWGGYRCSWEGSYQERTGSLVSTSSRLFRSGIHNEKNLVFSELEFYWCHSIWRRIEYVRHWFTFFVWCRETGIWYQNGWERFRTDFAEETPTDITYDRQDES